MPPILPSRMILGPVGTPYLNLHSSQDGLQEAVITACILGYIMIGVLTLVCINNFRLAELPSWYKDTERRTRHKVLLGFWYFGAIFLWPFVFPPWLACRLAFECTRAIGKISNKRHNRHDDDDSRGRRGLDLSRWEDIPLDNARTSKVSASNQASSGDIRRWRSTTDPSHSLSTIEEGVSARGIQIGDNAPSSDSTSPPSCPAPYKAQWELQQMRAGLHQGR